MALLASAGVDARPEGRALEWLFQGRSEMASVTLTTRPRAGRALWSGRFAFVHEPAHVARVPFILATAIAHGRARAAGARARARRAAGPPSRASRPRRISSGESLPLGLSTLAWAVRFFSPMLAVGWFAPGRGRGVRRGPPRSSFRCTRSCGSGSSTCCRTGRRRRRQPALLEKAVGHSLRSTARPRGAARRSGLVPRAAAHREGALRRSIRAVGRAPRGSSLSFPRSPGSAGTSASG